MTGKDKFSRFGVGQNVRRAWLDAALVCVTEGRSVPECRKLLLDIVCGGTTKTGARGKVSAEKVVGMLGAWFAPKQDMAKFVAQATVFARECPDGEIACLHWCVLCGTYPFFLEVTGMVGRLLTLQGKVSKAQLLRRCEERYGVSSTIARNLEYALWNLVEFGFLSHGEEKGMYVAADKVAVTDVRTTYFLWKGALHGTKGGSLAISTLREMPAFYPFALPVVTPGEVCAYFDDVECVSGIGTDDRLILVDG